MSPFRRMRSEAQKQASIVAMLVLTCALLAVSPKRLLASSDYQQLYSFYQYVDAIGTAGPLVRASDGFLYGTSSAGSGANGGLLFRIDTLGKSYKNLHIFGSFSGDGMNPGSSVMQGKDGLLYGTTQFGGANGQGAIYQLNLTGGSYKILYSFSGGDGAQPLCTLLQATDGLLYGTTYAGGANGIGTLFRLATDGTNYQLLHSFTGTDKIPTDGQWPTGALLQASNGLIYGMSAFKSQYSPSVIFDFDPTATKFTALYLIANSRYAVPGGLFQGADGWLYGTTLGNGKYGQGAVFKIQLDGTKFTSVHLFLSSGESILAGGVLQASDGNLYGTTVNGGANGKGVAFRMKPDGTGYTILQSFSASYASSPSFNQPLQGTDGSFYLAGSLTVSKLSLDGTSLTDLHTFAPGEGPLGNQPLGGVTQGADGTLYGLDSSGGPRDGGGALRYSAQWNRLEYRYASQQHGKSQFG